MKKLFALALSAALTLMLFGCGGGGEQPKTEGYSAEDVFNAVKNAYGDDFLPDGDMSEEEYTETYGLNMDDVEEIKAQITLVGFAPDRLIVVKTKKDKGDSVEASLNAAREALVENGMWYPANLPKVNAAAVARNGDYVAFIMLGANDQRPDATAEQTAEFADNETLKGINAFAGLFAVKQPK